VVAHVFFAPAHELAAGNRKLADSPVSLWLNAASMLRGAMTRRRAFRPSLRPFPCKLT